MSGRIPLFPPVFAPNASHPMVDDFSLRAARQQARAQPPGVTLTQPLPLRTNPMWSSNPELGREVTFAPDANNLQAILKLEEWGPPDLWTVALGLSVPVEDYTTNGWDTTAILQFGSGGVVQEVEIDWLQGSAITLPMNALNVVAKYNFETGGEGDFSPPPDSLRLRVSVTRGAAHNARPTRSYKRFFDGTADSQSLFIIPPFAKAVHASPALALPGITPFSFYSQTQAGRGFLQFSTDGVNNAIATYEYSQLVTYLDFINEVCGAPAWLPVPTYARYLAAIDGAGAAEPDNRISTVQFLIGV